MQDITNSDSYYLQEIHNFLKNNKMENQTEKHRRESEIMNDALLFLRQHSIEKMLHLTADPNSMDKACMIAQMMGDYHESKKINEWKSVKDGLPDNLNYHIIMWELPSPDGDSMVRGSRSAMCEIYKDKKWYGENGIYDVNPLNGVTHWMPFPKI